MKRKSIILTLCILLLTCLMAGCGEDGTVSEETLDAIKEQLEQEITPAPVWEQNDTVEPTKKPQGGVRPTLTASPTLTSTPTPTPTPAPVLCDRMDEWDNFYQQYGTYYSAVQIEDMFFYPGMLGSELGAMVEASEDKMIEAVAMTKLLEADKSETLRRDTQKLTYYRGGEAWFDVYVRNTVETLQPLEDCIVSLVLPCEAALEYCRFFDGTYTLESLKAVDYTGYDALAEKMNSFGYTMSESGNCWSVKSKNVFSMASLEESIYWTKQLMTVDLFINMATGLVENIRLTADKESTCQIYGRPIPEDFDWANEEFAKSLVTFFMKDNYAELLLGFQKPEVVSVFSGINAGHFIVVFRDAVISEYGKYNYAVYEMYNMGIDVKNCAAKLSEGIGSSLFYNYNAATLYTASLGEVYRIYAKAELLHQYLEDVDHYVSEDYNWENSRERLKILYKTVEETEGALRKFDSYTYLEKTEGEEVVLVFTGKESGDIIVVLRCTKPEEEGKYFYRAAELGKVVEDAAGELWIYEERYAPTNEGADGETYIEAGDAVFSAVPEAKLLYCYEEFRSMDSFADVTAEQLNHLIEIAFDKAESKYSYSRYKDYITSRHPLHVTFGNAEVEGEHLTSNYIYMAIKLEFNMGDDFWEEFVYVDFADPILNVNSRRIEYADFYVSKTYSDGYEMMDTHELWGTPEENQWITELLPYDMAMELIRNYEYEILEISVDLEGQE